MSEIKKVWHFPRSNRVQSLGLSGSGTDQFSNEPINNLAREIIQNSLDARAGKAPVVVEFHLFSTPVSDFPGYESFGEYVLKLYKQYTQNPKADEKEKAFVKNIVSALKYDKVYWLRISDFNTSGLYGSSVLSNQNTPWFAFINGAGKNQKEEYSGGSRGLGKNAIFVNSIIRTMFVSTFARNPDNGKEEVANTGIAKLLSYTLYEENPDRPDWTQGIGFCVEDSDEAREYNSPNHELLAIDPEYNREEMGYGTDIYLPCFSSEENWDDIISLETLVSFMPAIVNRDLIVKISYDNTTVVKEITPENIAMLTSGKGKNKAEAKALYNVLKSNQTKRIAYTNKQGFEMTLLMLQDNLNGLNEVYEYRLPTKMLIRHERKDCNVGYTGVLLIEGKDICKRLRSIEDATHRKWATSRYKESGFEKKDVEQALHILDHFVETECERFGSASSEEKVFFEVAGWNTEEDILNLSVEEQKDYGLPTDEIVCSMKSDTTKNPRRKPFKKKGNVIDDKGDAESDILDIGELGEGEGLATHPDGHNKGHGGEYHPGNEEENYDPNKGESLVMARKTIATANARMPSVYPDDGLFDLVFTPKKTGIEIQIEVLKSGVDGESESTTIYSAILDSTGESLEIKNNKILMDKIEKGVEYRLHLKISETKNYIWEVNIDGKE